MGVESTADLARATCGLTRLVVIGHTGFITLDALRWLSDIGSSYVQIEGDGKLIACYAPSGVNDVRLRIAQSLATTTKGGLNIARKLIADKLQAQWALLERSGSGDGRAKAPFDESKARVPLASNADELRWYEAIAASAYWNALAATPIRFVRTELPRVPAHWRVMGPRHVPGTARAMKAISPAMAMLNYLYAMLESEARIALLARGLDPDIGFLHSLQRFRSSLALDVMEPIRPAVDAFLLDLLATRVLSSGDFVETRQGICRLTPDLSRILAQTAPRWATQLGPVVSAVATALERGGVPARQSRVGAQPLRGSLQRGRPSGSARHADTSPRPRCAECGGPLSRSRYELCSSCERARLALLAPKLGGVEALQRLRAAGTDPAHGGAAGKKRSTIASKRHAEALAATGRERLTADERDQFNREVLPGITNVSIGSIAKATSLSKTYCSFIKRGLRVPHPRHWARLKSLGGDLTGLATR